MKKIIIALLMLPLISSAQTTWFAKTFTNWGGKFTPAKTGTLAQFVWYDTTLNGRIALDNYGTNGILGPSFNGRSALGNPETPLSISTDKVLLSVGGFGYNGTAFTNSANGTFTIRAASAFSTTSTPTYLTFSTTPIGTLTNTERLRILDNGTLRLLTLTTAGFMQNAANGDLFSTDASTTRTNLGLGSVATLNAIPYSSLTGTPSTFTPSVHTHGDADITALAYGKLTGAPTIPTNTNQLTNGAGFISSYTETDPLYTANGATKAKLQSDSSTLATAINGKQATLGFTPYNATNPSGYISSVPAQTFASLTGKPTTLSGYGITDNILLTNGSAAALTSFPTFNQNTTGTASNITGNLPQSQVTNLVTDLAAKQATLVSATNIKTVNGNSLVGAGDVALSTNTQVFVPLASAFSSTILTEVTVTGWSFSVTAGKSYRVRVSANYQTAATTTGGELGFFLTTAVGSITGKLEGAIVSTTAATQLFQGVTTIGAADLAGSNIITTGVTAINSPHFIGGEIIFTCTTSGTFNVGWASEVAASAAQLNAGSTLLYQQLN